jgi:hypothetical protein
VTSPAASVKALATSNAAPSPSKKSKTHPPKPYNIVQGMERVIDMIEETLQICERAQRSMQDVSHRKTFPFGVRLPSDAYAHQAAKSIQIQFGRQQPSGDLKVEARARRGPLDVPCIYHKGHDTLSVAAGYRRRSTRSATPHAQYRIPRLRTTASSRRPGSASPPTTRDPPGGAS